MSDGKMTKKGSNATVLILAFLLFYFPSMLAVFSRDGEPRNWILMSVLMATLYSLVFCVNYFWLVPGMLVKSDKPGLYFSFNIALIIVLCSIVPIYMISNHHFPRMRHMRNVDPTVWMYFMEYLRFVIRDGVMMILSAGLAYAMRLSRERENVKRRELELNAEQRQMELQSLKAQLNPHFLFNTLNNIYALIGFAPERAQQALHDLSGMLRFMIYDSVSAYVPLEKEFRFISDYVELVKLRMSPSVRISCHVTSNTDPTLSIAPLLLLTIVENAFKHCSASDAGHFIDIDIHETDGNLVCHVKNTIGNDSADDKTLSKDSGVGLENVKRQLGLVYPGKHSISLCNENGVFNAEIAVALSALRRREPDIKSLAS